MNLELHSCREKDIQQNVHAYLCTNYLSQCLDISILVVVVHNQEKYNG